MDRLEKIIWDDAGSFENEATWYTRNEVLDLYRKAQFENVSVGYVVFENEDSVIIAQSSTESTRRREYANLLRIPKKMILQRIKV